MSTPMSRTSLSHIAGARPASAPIAQPPAARRVPRASTTHGETRLDDYFWLRNREDP